MPLLWEKVSKAAERLSSVYYPQCDEAADGRLSGHVHKMPNSQRFCFQSDIFRCCRGDEAADKQRAQNKDDVGRAVTYQMKTSASCIHTKIFTRLGNYFSRCWSLKASERNEMRVISGGGLATQCERLSQQKREHESASHHLLNTSWIGECPPPAIQRQTSSKSTIFPSCCKKIKNKKKYRTDRLVV